ncbi:MAG: hypothetical protein P8Y67_15050, partial [Alphaproteobacteria bacterium]
HPGSGEQPIIAEPAFEAVAEKPASSPTPRRRRANGAAQRTEAASPAAPAESEVSVEAQSIGASSEENAEPVAKAVSEVKRKPRGSKRGWWQRRAAGE